MNELHRRAIVIDGHCDTPYRLHRHGGNLEDHDPDAQLDLDTLEASGITASFFAAYVPPYYAGRGAAAFADRLIDIIEAQSRRYAGRLVLCNDAAGIRRAKADGKIALMIGVEGGHAIEDSLEKLRHLYARGARYMTLTHVNTNNWCDSSGDAPKHGGLTAFGREVVGTMNDLGMIVDISHVSDDAFFQTIETTRVPIVATHSSCRTICRHPRNMTDEMLRTLAANGGVCMINFFSAFISDAVAEVVSKAQRRKKPETGEDGPEETPDDRTDWATYLEWFRSLGYPNPALDDIVDHIVHAASIAGVDHVGIGSDFDGVPALPDGMQTAADLPRLTDRMVERGMSDDDVMKVLGGNFLRVFDAVEAGRRNPS